MLKTLLNSRFLLLSVDRKKKRDEYLLGGNRGAKEEVASSKKVFLIILLYWPSLYFLKTDLSICKEEFTKKRERQLRPGHRQSRQKQ